MCCTSHDMANKFCLAPGTATAAGNNTKTTPQKHHTTTIARVPCHGCHTPSGHDDTNSQCHSAVAQGGWSRATTRRYSQGTRAGFVFSLERVGKAAAACCDQGSSNRARAPFSLEQDNSTSREGKVTNKTPGRVLFKSSRSRIGQLQILLYGVLFPGLQSCFWGYFLSGKAESHETPDSAWHVLTHLSELTDCQPK